MGFLVQGKHLLRQVLRANSKKKKIATYSYKDVIEKFLPFNERNIFNYFLLRVFFFFRKKSYKDFYLKNNLPSRSIYKKSFFQGLKEKIFKIYEENLDDIFKKNKEKKFTKITLNLIRKSNFSHQNKLIFIRWFKEEIVANYLINKNLNKIKFIIDSEGFIQRLFIYLYKKKKIRNKLQIYI